MHLCFSKVGALSDAIVIWFVYFRPCSTDKADGFVRSDGGTMVHVPRQGSLPIVKYRIESVAEGKDSFARVEIGNLYCIDQPTTISEFILLF